MAPKTLPPTDDEAEQHALRSLLQTHYLSLGPGLGFTLTTDGYEPLAIIKPMALEGLLNLISCRRLCLQALLVPTKWREVHLIVWPLSWH